ncbi:hypothetical protein [Magnetofaba australis]|uniref:hypothetical protein n=1 Tax=Magnetofaba australis TaxID=1472297 RepID=UPI000A19DD6B|nr:hypothetical protein [Magnetofaba australis]
MTLASAQPVWAHDPAPRIFAPTSRYIYPPGNIASKIYPSDMTPVLEVQWSPFGGPTHFKYGSAQVPLQVVRPVGEPNLIPVALVRAPLVEWRR